jgi:2-C-methyl-D-erythritol 4-phosphate cytidylyltransferase / 2-C-methyl-D-erythritol 2,4-cyclodiphosphate synthase
VNEQPAVVIVVVAAGSSARFGSDKLSATLGGRTVLQHAVSAIRTPYPAARLALVVAPDARERSARQWAGSGARIATGGARRQDSVRNGVIALAPDEHAVVVVHDGARPFVPAEDVYAVVAEAARSGAAILVAGIADTVKRLASDGAVRETVPRERLARSLTPQAFRAEILFRAWASVPDGSWNDEAELVEAAGGTVRSVPGDPRNVKVTTPEDLRMLAPMFEAVTRCGQGIDVHPFDPARPLWLCGLLVEGAPGLSGHSDADVALHAVTDAILGACGGGDIGQHFPPDDDRWRDQPSADFLAHSLRLLAERGFRLVHCDLTILAERPRIEPYRERMRTRLAELVGVAVAEVNLKATTCEGLGFIGRGEGMAALAVVTVAPVRPS